MGFLQTFENHNKQIQKVTFRVEFRTFFVIHIKTFLTIEGSLF